MLPAHLFMVGLRPPLELVRSFELHSRNEASLENVIEKWIITKTIKTPLTMAEAYGPTSCTSGLASESELSRWPKVHYGFVPKLSHHGGKNTVPLSLH